MSKFENMGITGTQGNYEEGVKEEPVFERDESDNKLFKEIQVKDPWERGIIRKETVGVWDFDTPIYRISQTMENTFIRVICKNDESISADLKGVTEFKGRGKKISESSWLGRLNLEREVEGLEILTEEDFTVEEHQKLKYDEEKAMEQAKILVYKKIKSIRQQYQLPKIKLLLGEGDTFRNKLPTCRPYKGNRKDTLRPLLLKKLRKWLVDELGATMSTPRNDGEMIECDDWVNIYKWEGNVNYLKNGWFTYIAISSDKDDMGCAGGSINPDLHSGEDNPLKGKFKFPQLMVIPSTQECAGNLEFIKNEIKGYGFKFLIYQAILGSDSADNYDALGHLKDSEYILSFGKTSAYKVLQPCKTAKEVLEKSLEAVYDLLPYGVQYKDHLGEEHDVDTLTYLNTYFLIAYMSRSTSDGMNLFNLCNLFKVDTDKLTDNNLWTAPYKEFNTGQSEEILGDVLSVLSSLKDNELKSYKSLNKGGLVERLDESLEKVDRSIEDINSRMFRMVQKNKRTGEIKEV